MIEWKLKNERHFVVVYFQVSMYMYVQSGIYEITSNYGKRIKPFYTKEWVFPNGQIHFTTWPARR